MSEKIKNQIVVIDKELKDSTSKNMSDKRRDYLIEETKGIAKDLDKVKELRGVFKSRIEEIYSKGEGKAYPRQRLNKVVKILKDEVGLESEKKK